MQSIAFFNKECNFTHFLKKYVLIIPEQFSFSGWVKLFFRRCQNFMVVWLRVSIFQFSFLTSWFVVYFKAWTVYWIIKLNIRINPSYFLCSLHCYKRYSRQHQISSQTNIADCSSIDCACKSDLSPRIEISISSIIW